MQQYIIMIRRFYKQTWNWLIIHLNLEIASIILSCILQGGAIGINPTPTLSQIIITPYNSNPCEHPSISV